MLNEFWQRVLKVRLPTGSELLLSTRMGFFRGGGGGIAEQTLNWSTKVITSRVEHICQHILVNFYPHARKSTNMKINCSPGNLIV